MVTNESKNFPPLSTAVKEAQKKVSLLSKEAKEIEKQWAQLRRDVRDGTITKEQSDALDEKLSARHKEIQQELFVLTMKTMDLK
jgi:chromosome segregation ATPase